MKNLRNRIGGKAAVVVLLLVLVLGVASFAAWKWFSNRPGEEAVKLIPADAAMVLTLDTTPSADQLALFKKISDAAESKGLMKEFDQTMAGMGGQSPIFKDIRPYLKKSFAVAFWVSAKDITNPSQPKILALLAITDPEAVKSIMGKYGKSDSNAGPEGYSFKEGQGFMALIDGYVAISQDADTLRRASKAASGGIPNVAELAEYRTARAQLPADANVMFFMSPKGIEAMQELSKGPQLQGGYKWMAFSLTLRSEGLAFDMQIPSKSDKDPAFAAMAKVKPLTQDFLNKLPQDAYGVLALAQPGAYIKLMRDALEKDPKLSKETSKGIAEFEKQTGLSLKTDLDTALNGDFALAVYPTPNGKSVDIVVTITDSNNADPSVLCQRVMKVIEKKSAEEKQPIKFVSSKVGETTIWKLDPKGQAMIVESLSPPSQQHIRTTPMDPEMKMPPAPPAPPSPFKDSTVAIAMVGKSVVIATSDTALKGALASYSGKSSGILSTTSYKNAFSKCVKDPKYAVMIDPYRIMQAFKPTLEQSLKGSPVSSDDLMGIFGDGKTSIIMSSTFDGEVTKASGMIPLDYVRLVNVISGLVKMGKPTGMDSQAMPEARM